MADAPEGDFLVLSQVSKRYGGVRALENVDFRCGRGKIHAVLGENGAGKSTLIKIVAGVVQPDAGSISLDGRRANSASPAAATAAGVVCIFQELSLMPDLSVADNISIATPPRRFGLIDARAQRRRAEALLAEVGCEDVNPLLRVRDLPLSRRQMVEIAKALGQKPQLLILDEATSALTSADVEKVYSLLARLKAENVAILYISHRMHEVEALADRASVFRNGRHIETFDKGARSTAEIVQLMIGRDIATQYPPKPKRARDPPRRSRSIVSVGRTVSRASRSKSARARSSASAGSTARARRRCCSPSSACCAALPAQSRSTGEPCGRDPRPRPRRAKSASLSFPRTARRKG